MNSTPKEALLDPAFIAKLDRLSLSSKRVFTGKLRGERRSKKKGFSVDFADYRNYTAGDDLRFLDWNIYGRLDRLFLKLFHEEEDLNIYVILDVSKSMDFGEPKKIELARRIAASLGYVGLASLDRVHMLAFSDGLAHSLVPQRGKASAHRLFGFLSELACAGKTSLRTSLSRFVRSFPRDGVVVILSDFFDREGLEESFRILASRHHEVFLVQVLSPQEIAPDLAGHLKLRDGENDDLVDVSVSVPLLKSYRRTLEDFLSETRELSLRRGFRYLFAKSDFPLEAMVLETLRAQGMVR